LISPADFADFVVNVRLRLTPKAKSNDERRKHISENQPAYTKRFAHSGVISGKKISSDSTKIEVEPLPGGAYPQGCPSFSIASPLLTVHHRSQVSGKPSYPLRFSHDFLPCQ
jgi:hypothetical protein